VALISIDEASCNRDGLCAAICPAGLILQEQGRIPETIADAESLCFRCGHCVAICPTGSLSHRDIDGEACSELDPKLNLSWEQTEQFFRSRRSIRHFKNKPVARQTVHQLIELARYAPTGHNSQDVRWLVLSNRQTMRELGAVVCDWMRFMLAKMPEFAKSLAMDMVLQRWEDGEDVILRNAPLLIIAYGKKDDRRAQTSCTIAMTHLELIAPSLGLGGCWAGFFTAAATTFPEMKKAVALPDDCITYGAMMLGYPRYCFHRTVQRNEPEITWRE